ncbi:glycoside hydrolase family 3 N-terminal domain-containing protein [Streptomyces sp. TRM64462]|uniref:beta-glucosidase n=1 Tax=Streptomyces sp. TRM64462 TaxID=2741726 RepID=UPI00158643A3|nr:glycoside hydrolase family 3 N-terminal domain-containing protein [Streptomyces sp. TRM64462]
MAHPWQDTTLPARDRAAALLARMTLDEKIAQLHSVWPGSTADGGDDVAPLQHELSDDIDLDALLPYGLGQLTRPFGTAPVEPAEGAAHLAALQKRVAAANRFGVPAVAHEECLTGFTAWRATVFPTPLAWGATFDPALVHDMAAGIGASLAAAGVHQGLAPVLDVTRDPRWGRTEETIGEDPYLVATLGTAYVQGLQSAGVVATLKHFAGYAASRGARNHAPASLGPRELADTVLPPFEMAVRDGGARSVMAAYHDIDGLPAHAHHPLLTTLLRDTWGFDGTVVADYFGVSFLELAHRVTTSPAESAALALAAGVDVELPAVRCYGTPLRDAVRAGTVPEEHIDRAALRVLTQKCELGLLDADWAPPAPPPALDLDPPELRALARRAAEESVVVLADGAGVLPLRLPAGGRIAVVGPLADDPAGMLGCYSFPRHVGVEHPELPLGVTVPTLLASLRAELPGTEFVTDPADADLCVAVVGDRSGLFGRGTSGEGCDAPDLRLPDGQGDLLDTLVEGPAPVVLVLLTGRPYALGRWADRLAAVVQAFFPGQEGGPAVAGVLTGRVEPSGRLPVSVPRDPGGQPWTYLAPPLGHRSGASSLDPTPLYPFGHGLSYTTFTWEPAPASAAPASAAPAPADPVPAGGTPAVLRTDGETAVAVTVRNTGTRPGTEVVQLYLDAPAGPYTRPVARLVGYARVPLAPGAAADVRFTVPADVTAHVRPDGTRRVEPGPAELRFGASSTDIRHTVPLTLTGPPRTVGHDRRMRCEATVTARTPPAAP